MAVGASAPLIFASVPSNNDHLAAAAENERDKDAVAPPVALTAGATMRLPRTVTVSVVVTSGVAPSCRGILEC